MIYPTPGRKAEGTASDDLRDLRVPPWPNPGITRYRPENTSLILLLCVSVPLWWSRFV